MERVSRVGVRVAVDASHTRFDFHAATVGHGGIMGVPGRARPRHIVDGSKRSTANVLADAVSGFKDASIQICKVRFPSPRRWERGGTCLILAPTPGRVEDWLGFVWFDMMVICVDGEWAKSERALFYPGQCGALSMLTSFGTPDEVTSPWREGYPRIAPLVVE